MEPRLIEGGVASPASLPPPAGTCCVETLVKLPICPTLRPHNPVPGSRSMRVSCYTCSTQRYTQTRVSDSEHDYHVCSECMAGLRSTPKEAVNEACSREAGPTATERLSTSPQARGPHLLHHASLTDRNVCVSLSPCSESFEEGRGWPIAVRRLR